jgi:hypothetical protein
MIRIDEIYENTFLPWIRKNCPDTAMFYCDPFGRSDHDSILCRGLPDGKEKNSIFFFDQEPVQLSIHLPTFQSFNTRSVQGIPKEEKFVVTSETNSDNVDYICKAYELQPFYYFFHGWAALDWYRGYDRTFLITPLEKRHIKKTFFSANRIIGGERSHRVVQLYHFKLFDLMHNHISAPRICPAENVDITSIAQKYTNVYQDIADVFNTANLPRVFAGEETQNMTSCWLTNFDEAQDSLVYVPTETVYFGRRLHITEKTFKAIALEMPFVLVAAAGSLEYMRRYGFKTFSSVFDESYDEETNDIQRIERVTKLLKDLDKLPPKERQEIHRACLPIVEYNYNHFYRGEFGNILWTELIDMLNNLQKKLL